MHNSATPQWQATDEDARPVRVHVIRSASAGNKKGGVRMANRMPAAIFGILLFIAIGIAFQQGLGGLLGQATETEERLTVHIKEQGVEPEELSVQPGEYVLFKNESSIPHIISAQTLMMSDGKPLETTAIFPGSEEEIQIPLSASPGTYQYISTTSTSVTGRIVVLTNVAANASSAFGTDSSVAHSLPSSNQFIEAADDTGEGMTDVPVVTGIPQNPYTVGSDDSLPVKQLANTVTTGTPTITPTIVTQHTPKNQPETGSALWVTGIILAASLLFVLRKSNA